MEEASVILERHEQRINTLERDISDLKAVQTEIRTMNETLVTLATELKHTNEHLFEGVLIVENELIAVISGKGSKCDFWCVHKNLRKKCSATKGISANRPELTRHLI